MLKKKKVQKTVISCKSVSVQQFFSKTEDKRLSCSVAICFPKKLYSKAVSVKLLHGCSSHLTVKH